MDSVKPRGGHAANADKHGLNRNLLRRNEMKAEERRERKGGARPCHAVALAKADPDEPF